MRETVAVPFYELAHEGPRELGVRPAYILSGNDARLITGKPEPVVYLRDMVLDRALLLTLIQKLEDMRPGLNVGRETVEIDTSVAVDLTSTEEAGDLLKPLPRDLIPRDALPIHAQGRGPRHLRWLRDLDAGSSRRLPPQVRGEPHHPWRRGGRRDQAAVEALR